MENNKLSEKLRELARGCSSPYKKQILKQAAKRIMEQAEMLDKAGELLRDLGQRLPKMECGCELCDHRDVEKICLESEEMIFCDNCPAGCYCRDCGPDGDKWENSVLKEVLREVNQGGAKGAPPVADEAT